MTKKTKDFIIWTFACYGLGSLLGFIHLLILRLYAL